MQDSQFLLLIGLPAVVTAIVYFLLHRRLGFLWIYLVSLLASWGLAYVTVIRHLPAQSGFEGLFAGFVVVAYIPFCLLVAFLCRLLVRHRTA